MLQLQVQGSRHITLVCRDVRKMAKFFAEILEVPVDVERAEPNQPYSFNMGSHTRIGLYPGDPKGNSGGKQDPITFAVTTRGELDYLVDKLEEFNICYRGLIDRDTSYHLYFETPDGHPLEVMLRKENHDDT